MAKFSISFCLLLLIITYLCVFNLAISQDHPQLVKKLLGIAECVDQLNKNCKKDSDCRPICIERHKDNL